MTFQEMLEGVILGKGKVVHGFCMEGAKEKEATNFRSCIIACGLHHITEVTREEAFGGRGSAGPQHCMTDDCDAEERGLKLTWPTVKHLLCIFNICQSAWRWLHDATNSG